MKQQSRPAVVRHVHSAGTGLLVLLQFLTIFIALAVYGEIADEEDAGEKYMGYTDDESCQIAVIPVYGNLQTTNERIDGETHATSADDIIYALHQADASDSIMAIVLEIDSGGGDTTVGEEVSMVLKAVSKPVVAYIRSEGLSTAYWIASQADYIITDRTAYLGSIGVTGSYLDKSRKNQEEGIVFQELTTGAYKEVGNVNRQLSPSERAYLLSLLKEILNIFIEAVASGRHMTVEEVRAIADGSYIIGVKSVDAKLADAIGGWREVREYLEEQTGSELSYCQRAY